MSGIGVPADARLVRIVAAVLAALALLPRAGLSQPPASPSPPAQVETPSPDDDRTPTLLIDRAAATLAALQTDRTDASILFGIPTPDQRKHAETAARAALALLQDADTRAAAVVKKLEDSLIGAHAAPLSPDTAARTESVLARLVDVEQAQRLPLLRGECYAILSGAVDPPARADAVRSALAHLAKLRLPNPESDAARSVFLAAALLNSPKLDDPTREAARRELESAIAREPARDPTAPPTLARLGRMTIDQDHAPGDSRSDALSVVNEATARFYLNAARRDPLRRVEFTRETCRRLSVPERSSAAERLTIYAKLATIVDGSVPLAELPAEACFARAVTLLRDKPDSAEAASILKALDERSDVPEQIRPDVLWERLVLLSRRTDQAPADLAASRAEVELLLRFLDKFPTDPRAARAEQRAAALTESDLWQTPEGQTAWRQRREALDRLTERAAEKYPTPLRTLRAFQRRLKSLHESPSIAAAGEVMTWFGRLDEKTRTENTPTTRAALAESIRTISGARPQASLEYARAIDAMLGTLPGERQPATDLLLAETFARSDEAPDTRRAAELFRKCLTADEPRATIGLAVLQRRAGDGPGAIATLRALTDRADSSHAAARPPWYWQAWTEIIEIMERQHAPDLRAQIKRLELLDPALGGPENASRITAVRDRAR